MNASTGSSGIPDNWLVDVSELLSDGESTKTKVILYNPNNEREYEEILLDLEGLTIEEICKTQVTFKDVRRYEQYAELRHLRAFFAL